MSQSQMKSMKESEEVVHNMGLSSCLSLNLIKLILSFEEKEDKNTAPQNPRDTSTEFKDVFEGLGSFPAMNKIQKPEIKVIEPVIHPPRKIPITLQDKLERELKSMEELQVTVKATGPKDWVNSIATPEKQSTGALRVCLDPRDLHRAVKCEHSLSSPDAGRSGPNVVRCKIL